MKTALLIKIIQFTLLIHLQVMVVCAAEDGLMEKYAKIVSKCDIGYKASYGKGDLIPVHIDILICNNNERKAIEVLRTAPLENMQENLNQDSRVCFLWIDDDGKRSETIMFAEKDGKIRLHDTIAKKGHWIDLGEFLAHVQKFSPNKKKIIWAQMK